MAKQALQILLFSVLLLLLSRCAQMGELTGGERDTVPPKLAEAMPADKSTGFSSDIIVLTFNEFVQVKDLSNQLIISPKLKTAPEITASGKKINIVLKKEELEPNTTYRFYFGTAIADMNESNSIQNFEYVVSTGNYIDSLKIKGTVTDAVNNKAAGNTLIGLYNYNASYNDSMPFKDAPDYISRSNESGEFVFGNLPYKKFKAYAIADKNKNNFYDGESEKVAFLDSVLNLVSDTSISFNLFQEESPKGFIKKTVSPYYGLSQVILNKKAKVIVTPISGTAAGNISETRIGQQKDTVSVYYKGLKDTLELEINNLSAKKKDTLRLALPRNNAAKKRLKSISANTQSGTLALGTKVKLSFLTWMDTSRSDLKKVIFTSKEDSLVAFADVKGSWTSITTFEFSNQLKEGANYNIRIDTAAFFDINGFPNDSLRSGFKTQSKLEFGKVALKILLNKKQNYIIQLINSSDQVFGQRFVSFSLSSSNAASINFTDVPPGTYFVKIIFDDNDNKKPDTGNLLLKQQPERVIINSKQLKVLSDWEIEEEIVIKE